MAHVVTEPCLNCKHLDCTRVCPMDCFYQDDRMLYIDPDECIDCGACLPECPVSAIFLDEEVPAPWKPYIALNAERVQELRAVPGSRATG